jgi:hypothetical protein
MSKASGVGMNTKKNQFRKGPNDKSMGLELCIHAQKFRSTALAAERNLLALGP